MKRKTFFLKPFYSLNLLCRYFCFIFPLFLNFFYVSVKLFPFARKFILDLITSDDGKHVLWKFTPKIYANCEALLFKLFKVCQLFSREISDWKWKWNWKPKKFETNGCGLFKRICGSGCLIRNTFWSNKSHSCKWINFHGECKWIQKLIELITKQALYLSSFKIYTEKKLNKLKLFTSTE